MKGAKIRVLKSSLMASSWKFLGGGALMALCLPLALCSQPPVSVSVDSVAATDCPCKDAAHCQPIATGPRKELLGFITNKVCTLGCLVGVGMVQSSRWLISKETCMRKIWRLIVYAIARAVIIILCVWLYIE